MTIRHIIVEGPDGSGKDGLITLLMPRLPNHTVHDRASTSLGGPVPSLTAWYEMDMRSIDHTGPWVYNRHPMISELIYAPIARRVPPQGKFSNADWVMAQLDELAKRAIVVWCLPPWSRVRDNINRTHGQHMPGVAESIRDIYLMYRRAAGDWPGVSLYWDYTDSEINNLVFDINQHLSSSGVNA